MPRFDRKAGGGDDESKKKTDLVVPESWSEPRCHVCNSKYRQGIDRLIALGESPTEISRIFGGEIDRRSIKRHGEQHLAYENAAIRRIIEKTADKINSDMEDGIEIAVTRRAFTDVFIKKAFDALASGDLEITAKDALAAIQLADKFDSEVEGAALDELRVQFNAFVQAIREICPPEDWQKILDRTKQLLKLSPIADIRPSNDP